MERTHYLRHSLRSLGGDKNRIASPFHSAQLRQSENDKVLIHSLGASTRQVVLLPWRPINGKTLGKIMIHLSIANPNTDGGENAPVHECNFLFVLKLS